MYSIPTYDEAMNLVDTNSAFYVNRYDVDGVEVAVFNYRLAQPSDFADPKACEMRGLTFVKNGDTWDRFIMLHKFFNVNQTDGYMLDDIKDLSVTRVQHKMDGSMIRFIWAGRHNIVAKTKMGFDNDQATAANRILLSNETLYTFVRDTLNKGRAAIFEYIAPTNRIVVSYKEEKLVLLQIRDEQTGEYLDLSDVEDVTDRVGCDIVEYYDENLTVAELLQLADAQEDVEGWVVTLENGQMVKVKTKWYCDRHRLLTVDAYHENTIIQHILDETYDDLIATLDSDDPVRDNMNKVLESVRKWFAVTENLLGIEIAHYHSRYKCSRKDYAIDNNKNPLFPVVMKVIDGRDPYTAMVDFLRKKTSGLEDARKFLTDLTDKDGE